MKEKKGPVFLREFELVIVIFHNTTEKYLHKNKLSVIGYQQSTDVIRRFDQRIARRVVSIRFVALPG